MNTTNLTIKILWVDMTCTFNFHATSTKHKLIMYNVTRGDWFKTSPGINCANTTKSFTLSPNPIIWAGIITSRRKRCYVIIHPCLRCTPRVLNTLYIQRHMAYRYLPVSAIASLISSCTTSNRNDDQYFKAIFIPQTLQSQIYTVNQRKFYWATNHCCG